MDPRKPLLILAAVLSIAGGPAHALQPSATSDSAARAAIIYNFTRFSTWRDDRFASATSPVVLCVQPGHPLAPSLVAFDGRPVGDRILRVRRTGAFDGGCHAALVNPENADAATLTSLSRAGVLTIGDSRGFVGHGAIGMITVGRQIRFEINNRVARDAGVVLSSRLLRLAVAVR